MTTLAVMLSVALVPTAFPPVEYSSYHLLDQPVYYLRELPGVPAWCAFNSMTTQRLGADNGAPMIISEIILLGGLLIRFAGMFYKASRLRGSSPRSAMEIPCRKFLVGRCDKLQISSKLNQVLSMPLLVFSLGLLMSIQSVLDFLGSDLCSVGASLVNPTVAISMI